MLLWSAVQIVVLLQRSGQGVPCGAASLQVPASQVGPESSKMIYCAGVLSRAVALRKVATCSLLSAECKLPIEVEVRLSIHPPLPLPINRA